MQAGGHRKALIGNLEGGRNHLLETHRAVKAQRRQPGVGRRRCHRAEHARRQVAAVAPVKVVDAGGSGPSSQAADRHGLLAASVVDDDRGDAAEARPLGQHHVDGDAGGHTGIGGVAALFQNSKAGGRGQVVPGRHHVGVPRHRRTVGPNADCHDAPQ